MVEPDIPVLRSVRNWAIQLQGLEREAAVRELETAPVDMVVIEPVRSQRGLSAFPTAALVARLQESPGATMPHKRCIAYLNVGQAEDYRDYWRGDWRAPTEDGPGTPPFLLARDPDGWPGNFPVAYWDPAWRRCLFGSPEALLDRILADGFEGVYLDWVLACEHPRVVAAAQAAGIDPHAAMVDLLADLRAHARARYPLFVSIAQNGVGLAERAPRMLQFVDALAQEDLCFRGRAGAGWHAPEAGDVPAPPAGEWSTARLCERLAAVAASGLPVFTLDYALRSENVAAAVRTSRSRGFVPFVTRAPLDRLAPPVPPGPPGPHAVPP